MAFDVRTLKRGLLLLWALWWSVVCLTNLLDALKALGLLGADWRFASGNYAAIAKTTALYGTPEVVNGLLFAGVILWEALAAVLFWAAWRHALAETGGARRPVRLYTAFVVGLALMGAFILADELTFAWALEDTHRGISVWLLVSLLALRLLPDRA